MQIRKGDEMFVFLKIGIFFHALIVGKQVSVSVLLNLLGFFREHTVSSLILFLQLFSCFGVDF